MDQLIESCKPHAEKFALWRPNTDVTFPWLGVMLWGVAAGQWLMRARPQWLQVRVPAPARPLVTLGRWSLTWYMLHQPVLIGALMAWQALR